MAVIKDVAQHAGVSISTVSKYFNNPNALSEPYKSRVAEAVRALDYHPNAIARSLRTKQTGSIALVVPDITNTYYVEVYNAIRSELTQRNIVTQLFTIEENTNILRDLLGRLTPAQVDGIIVCFLDEDSIIGTLTEAQSNIPITLLSWDAASPFNSVVIDLHSAIRDVTNYLIGLGHVRIAYASGPQGSRISNEKINGYYQAMNMHGLPIPDGYIHEGVYTFQNGYLAAQQFMRTSAPPTAIVCANDMIAVGCCKYLISEHYRIPQDVAVTGMDGTQLSLIYDPPITTMAEPIKEMCHEAVTLLLYKIEHPSSKNKTCLLRTKLEIRRSTDFDVPLYIDF